MRGLHGRLVVNSAFLYGFFGPLVGLLLTMLMLAVACVVTDNPGDLRNLPIVFIIGIPMSFVIGVVPAAITGAIAAALRPHLADRPLVAVATVVGAAAASAWSPVVRGILGEGLGNAGLLAIAGACSMFALTLKFVGWTRPRAPDAPSPT